MSSTSRMALNGSELRVFSLTNGADTAGIGYRLARAFELHGGPDWHLDTMVATQNYIDYPVDVAWNQRRLEELYDAADVVLIHHFMFTHDNYDFGQGKPTVMMHHGLKNGTVDTFASTVKECSEQDIVQVCSTLDMQIWTDGLASWVPPPYNLEWLRGLREKYYRPSETLRVVHAPTNREVKGTDLLLEAINNLQRDGYKIQLLMPERRTWSETLATIAQADVAFDQPRLGYGCFAVEAMGMGLPVIAGVVDDAVRDGMREYWGTLPFYHVEPRVDSITDALHQLLDPFGRELYSGLATRHVERYHDAAKVVERLKPILAGAGRSKPGGSGRRITYVGGEPRARPLTGQRRPKRAIQTIRRRNFTPPRIVG